MFETLRELGNLKAQFPAFKFRIIRGHHGRHQFEAVRKGGPGDSGGLYAVISGDAAEVAEELTADELRRAA